MSRMLEVAPNGEILYCIATNTYSPKHDAWASELHYLHAKNQGDARVKFCLSFPNRNTHQVVAIAPAIGWITEGKKDRSGAVVKDIVVAD
jgi:hypothetical protein